MPIVLIVDDEEMIRLVLRQFFAPFDLEILEAADGEEALGIIRTRRVDLVICDLIMPRLDGIATIMGIRRIAPGVRIIAMSGGGRIHALELLKVAGQMGADHVMAKPFTRNQILDVVGQCLAGTVAPATAPRAAAGGR